MDRQGPPIMRLRFLEVPLLARHFAQAIECIGNFGVLGSISTFSDSQRFLEGRPRPIILAAPRVHIGQIE